MFVAAPGKNLTFVGNDIDEVRKEIAGLADEAIENVYGHIVSQFMPAASVAFAVYKVKVIVVLAPQ